MTNIVWTPLEDGRYRDRYGDYIIIDEQFLSLEDGDAKTRCVLPVDVRLCRATPAPAPLQMPDGPGWWAWEHDGMGGDRGIVEIYDSNGVLRSDEEPGGFRVNYYPGRKWWRVYMPWEQRTEEAGE